MIDIENIHSFSNEVHLEWINNRMLVVFLNEVIISNIPIPKGFITDGATIPKLFWNILSPFGRFFKSCALHDYICLMAKLKNNEAPNLKEGINIATQYRKRADTLLSLSMKKQGIKLWRRLLIMTNVRTYTFFTFSVGHRIYKHKFKIELYYGDNVARQMLSSSMLSAFNCKVLC
ncbi:DUF1353 domain-containing protein [Helicobacter pylori]|uniref:DUF1353 domain-containing protein n=1 Tax=Helicobacter pylori TaxID=210 RepID=UPI00112B41C5|nr:DUF1353 domain-containing protein [Helicobacter pylori]TPH93729.1 DUF1353 domain-containing protein [Helicobacter pylori]